MAKSEKYIKLANELCKATIIAIDSIQKHPEKNWSDEYSKNKFIEFYQNSRELIENAEPKFQNMSSLKYDQDAILTYFQESSGEDVEYFWKQIKEQDLPFKRENKMLKILKRKKINNDIEYDFVIDVMVAYRQEDMITDDEVKLLNDYIAAFENKKRKSK